MGFAFMSVLNPKTITNNTGNKLARNGAMALVHPVYAVRNSRLPERTVATNEREDNNIKYLNERLAPNKIT
jgi:hypothetical protein